MEHLDCQISHECRTYSSSLFDGQVNFWQNIPLLRKTTIMELKLKVANAIIISVFPFSLKLVRLMLT